MKVNPDIFKAYDIRGKYPREINEEAAERIGNATAVFLIGKLRKKRPHFIICYDVRTSSPRIKNAVIQGILDAGCDVEDVGLGTTPFFYFLMRRLKPDGGIMVTASHNPAEYNGMKIRGRGGAPISLGSGLEKIRAIAFRRAALKRKEKGKMLDAGDYRDEYLSFLAKGVSIGRIRTVIDAAGGSTAYFLPRLLNNFPEVIYKPLFFEPDGSFSRHSPNPLLNEAQKFIKQELASEGFRFGALFDGDGDRVFFFDEKGSLVRPDHIFGILAEDILKRIPRSTFVMTITTSKGVREHLEKKGARIVLSRVGYTFVRPAMRKTGAALATELSGHFFFKELEGDESGLFCWLRIASLLSHTPRPLSSLTLPLKTYISSDEINFSVRDKKAVALQIRKFYRKGKISQLDGITVEFQDWWFNLRPSNTEPFVRLVLEARTEELFREKLNEVENILKKG